jgi:hypothetical protein
MTKEFPMTNPECPGAGNHFVIQASSFNGFATFAAPSPTVQIKITHHSRFADDEAD